MDFLVKFGDGVGFLEYSQLERKISEALGRKAELTVSRVLLNEPRFAARVCREAVAV